eukprot:1608461-Rhodomonas_salina.2
MTPTLLRGPTRPTTLFPIIVEYSLENAGPLKNLKRDPDIGLCTELFEHVLAAKNKRDWRGSSVGNCISLEVFVVKRNCLLAACCSNVLPELHGTRCKTTYVLRRTCNEGDAERAHLRI